MQADDARNLANFYNENPVQGESRRMFRVAIADIEQAANQGCRTCRTCFGLSEREVSAFQKVETYIVAQSMTAIEKERRNTLQKAVSMTIESLLHRDFEVTEAPAGYYAWEISWEEKSCNSPIASSAK